MRREDQADVGGSSVVEYICRKNKKGTGYNKLGMIFGEVGEKMKDDEERKIGKKQNTSFVAL